MLSEQDAADRGFSAREACKQAEAQEEKRTEDTVE
jgi:hypothetical protein